MLWSLVAWTCLSGLASVVQDLWADAPPQTQMSQKERLMAPAVAGTPEDPERVAAATEVHWSQVLPLRTKEPAFPLQAKNYQLEGDCLATVYIDKKGRVFYLAPRSCPSVFWQPTVDALNAWKFRPYGRAKEDQFFTVKMSYVLD